MNARGDFWARRRAGVAAEAKAEQAALEAQALRDEQAAFEEMDEAEMLAALDLPDPDTLKQGDDFSVFMAKAVPDQIRRRALRTLWRSNPVLANVDMLVDYGEDYSDAAMAVENIQTAYQVGKGMLKHVEEMARQAEARANPPVIHEPIEDTEPELVVSEVPDVPPAVSSEKAVTVEIAEPAQDYATVSPRRMTFRTEEPA